MEEVLTDLLAEHEDLDSMVSRLDTRAWDLPTPAVGWAIRDQITHLAFFDEKAALSARDPDAFVADVNSALAEGIDSYLEGHLERGRALTPPELLSWWRQARTELLGAFSGCDPDERLLWYGPPMRARSSAVARLMETWAHGQDVADALGVQRRPTDRLLWIAELGTKTFSWSFTNRGLDVPPNKVRVELRSPSGSVRVWNEDETELVTGDAEEFCLVVAQRRHIDDTNLVVEGTVARHWMEIAQVFAGPPGPGREPAAE